MAIKQKTYFKVSSTDVNAYSATTGFNTDALDLSTYKGAWLFQVSRSASDGTTSCTIQASQNGTDWVSYDPLLTSFSIPAIKERENFYSKYMRVVYSASGSPTGTITMTLVQLP